MQKLLALLLALAATVHCQSAIIPNSAPPEPSGGAPPSGGAQPSGGAEPVGGVPPGAPLVTIGGNTIAAGLDGAYDLGKQTLERGSAITNQGTVYSLAPGGMFLVADGKTSTIREGAGGRLPIFSMNAMSSAAAMGTGGFGVGISSSSYSFGPSASSAAMTGWGVRRSRSPGLLPPRRPPAQCPLVLRQAVVRRQMETESQGAPEVARKEASLGVFWRVSLDWECGRIGVRGP